MTNQKNDNDFCLGFKEETGDFFFFYHIMHSRSDDIYLLI